MRRSQPFALLILPLLALVGCGDGGESAASAAQQSGSTAVVNFQAVNESGMMGSLMMAPGGENVTVNTLGIGSSSTQVAGDELASGSHFVQVHQPDGTPAACADLP